MSLQTEKEQYNSSLNWLLVTPVIAVVFGRITDTHKTNQIFTYLVLLLVFASVAYLYWAQVKYLKHNHPSKRIGVQVYVMLAALCLPFAGIFIGDYMGATNYGVAANGLGYDVRTAFLVGGSLAFLYLLISVINNAFYIRTGGKDNSTILRVIGRILYVLGYVIVAVVSWISYTLTYSLHDPSVE